MNKVILMGRLCRDPEIRHTQSSKGEELVIARYTLAVDRRGRIQEGQQSADFISCVAMGKGGEFVEKYLKQGIKVAITGHIQTGSYTDREGRKVYTTDVMIEDQEFAEKKGTSEGAAEPAPEGSSEGFMDIPENIVNDLPFK